MQMRRRLLLACLVTCSIAAYSEGQEPGGERNLEILEQRAAMASVVVKRSDRACNIVDEISHGEFIQLLDSFSAMIAMNNLFVDELAGRVTELEEKIPMISSWTESYDHIADNFSAGHTAILALSEEVCKRGWYGNTGELDRLMVHLARDKKQAESAYRKAAAIAKEAARTWHRVVEVEVAAVQLKKQLPTILDLDRRITQALSHAKTQLAQTSANLEKSAVLITGSQELYDRGLDLYNQKGQIDQGIVSRYHAALDPINKLSDAIDCVEEADRRLAAFSLRFEEERTKYLALEERVMSYLNLVKRTEALKLFYERSNRSPSVIDIAYEEIEDAAAKAEVCRKRVW